MDETSERYANLRLLRNDDITVNVICPDKKVISITLSKKELVHEIHQLLMDHEETCHRSCFSLYLDGAILDKYTELKKVQRLQNNSTLHVVEEPYTLREARTHVRHIRGLLKSVDPTDACNGIECNSLTFLNVVTQGDILEKKKSQSDIVDCTPPQYVMPNTKEPPLMPLQPNIIENFKELQAVKIFTTSAWNPPPGSRKLVGDLMYLYVVTMEDKHFHITACTKGFYVNQSTNEVFNPDPGHVGNLNHSVVDLLNQLSPCFKHVFQQIQEKRTLRHAIERVPTPFQIYQWAAPRMDHVIDAIRAEDAFSAKLGHEENLPGQTRDWNEELQAAREMPRKILSERLSRERAIFKVHTDFVIAATRGAVAIIDGDILPINPGDNQKIRMFLWNNIFFSRGFDLRDQYNELGGEVAAFVAPRNDLSGVRAYTSADVEGLYTLGTVVIDYRGQRITAQSIIPGVLDRDQDQTVVYGSLDFGKTVLSDPKYVELLHKAGKHCNILPHFVLNEENEPVELCSSVECKGIIGNDGRHYILDLLRTFPPDVNFLKLNIELCPQLKAMGFPLNHKHKLCCLRQELLDAFIQDRYVSFVKYFAITNARMTSEIAKLACAAVGSLKEKEFEIHFNPDIFSPSVRHLDDDKNSVYKQKKLVQDAAEFLVLKQIPAFIKEQIHHISPPMDSATFTEALHGHGINIRYLGKVLITLTQIPQMNYMYRMGIMELIIRSAKHIYYTYIKNVDTMYLSLAISHFLNCFLTTGPTNLHDRLDKLQSFVAGNKRGKNRNRKVSKIQRPQQLKNHTQTSGTLDNQDWIILTPKSLWLQINKEAKSYWDYHLSCETINVAIKKYSVQRISILRGFCQKVGIQILLREYTFDSCNTPTFSEGDILNIFPLVKHVNPRASDAYELYTLGQSKVQDGSFQEGYEQVMQAINLLNNVFGAVHTEVATCLRSLARLSYLKGDAQGALAIQQRALIMSERVNGIDHPTTIVEYTHLALYCFANGLVSTSLKLLYRAKYLLILIFGEDHPEIARIDSNLNLILYAVGENELALHFIERATKLNLKYFGSNSMQVAASYRLAARTQTSMGDFRAALNSEKETYFIYKSQLGADHEKTRESADCLHLLTRQAVLLQRKLNDVHFNGASNKSIPPPLNFQTPSLKSVLDMLNTINGVFFIQLTQKHNAKITEEIAEYLKVAKEINENIQMLRQLSATNETSPQLPNVEGPEPNNQNIIENQTQQMNGDADNPSNVGTPQPNDNCNNSNNNNNNN